MPNFQKIIMKKASHSRNYLYCQNLVDPSASNVICMALTRFELMFITKTNKQKKYFSEKFRMMKQWVLGITKNGKSLHPQGVAFE